MRCASCGHANRESAKFCEQCGQTLHGAPARSAQAPDPRAYTPRHLAERILTARAALEGERKQVTVLFADIQDSMPLAERVGAEEWHRLLDRFFQLLNEGVHRFEGTVNQYTGDGVMALFGAPLAHEDHAQRACHAALYLCERLRSYSAQLRSSRGFALEVRMGLNSGEVVVGTIGDDLRMDYTAQGHTVGLAQRVQQLAAPGTVCVAQATATLVADYFDLRALGTFELKGVAHPVAVFALDGLARARSRLDVAYARSGTGLVGRHDELAVLEHALDEAAAGHGRVLGVVGEPGVGKTRLCLELLQQCQARGVVLAQAHCPAHAANIALLPIVALLRNLFEVREGDAPELARKKIRRSVRQLGRGFADALPVAFDALGVSEPERVPPLLEEQRRAQLATFLRRLVQAQSARTPLLLFVDDVHCIDADADALLGEIADALGWTRTLLLVTFRPEHRSEWMHGPNYRELPLTPLSGEATDELLCRLLGDDPSTGDLRRLVGERTAGNPFFAEEVVQSLLDHGALVRTAEPAARAQDRPALRLTRPIADLSIPPTVHALLAARLDRLPERDKQIAQAAAVIGRSFAPAVLRHMLAQDSGAATEGRADDGLDGALAALEGADFIRRADDGPDADYVFRHPLTQAVAYDTQLATARARLHVAVARALQELHADQLGQYASLLAHHFAAADWRFEATRWRRRAALRVTAIELGRGHRGPRG